MNVPRGNKAYLEYVGNILDIVRPNMTAWEISTTRFKRVENPYLNTVKSYNINAAKATRGDKSAADLKVDMKKLKPLVSDFVVYLRGNTNIPDEMLIIMNIPPRRSTYHKAHPVPEDEAVFEFRRVAHMLYKIIMQSLADGQPRKTMTDRRRHHGYRFQYILIDHAAPIPDVEAITNWKTLEFTKLRETITFPESAEGKRLIGRAAWMNHSLQCGPWSEPVNITLS